MRPLEKEDADSAGSSGDCGFSVGHRLQDIRKRRGLTQKKLGERVGLTREAVASYEAGRVHLNDTAIVSFARALRVSADEILGLRDPSLEDRPLSRRLMKRFLIIETLPETTKRRIILTLDDSIKANTRLSILND